MYIRHGVRLCSYTHILVQYILIHYISIFHIPFTRYCCILHVIAVSCVASVSLNTKKLVSTSLNGAHAQMRVRNTDPRARVQQVPVAVDRPVEKVHVIWKILSHRARQAGARVRACQNLARAHCGGKF